MYICDTFEELKYYVLNFNKINLLFKSLYILIRNGQF